MHSDITRAEYYPKLNQCLKRISRGEYKKNRADMFSVLKPYIETAIVNAKKLYAEKKKLVPSEASPCTTVFQLIEALLPYIVNP